jgi:hypothetical protein
MGWNKNHYKGEEKYDKIKHMSEIHNRCLLM